MLSFIRFLAVGFVCLGGLTSCVTEFQPDVISLPPALVVEGEVTDQPGPYTIRLTRTADYSIRSLNLLETGAVVVISDNAGNQETLVEQTGGGVYQTVPGRANGIRGVAGRRYTLRIQTKSGQRYESSAEVLPAVPPIERVYYEYRNEPNPTLPQRDQGWDVYIDSKDPDTLGNYYRWTWTHYELLQACQKTFVQRLNRYQGISCCSNCWSIDRCYNCISINSDANVNGQAISRQLITRVPYTSLSRYYIAVEQQALSAGAYQFWKSVRQLVSNTGGLFDAAPGPMMGNMRCVSDPALQVYGYFGATGLSSKVIYVDRSAGQGPPLTDLPVEIPFPTNPSCIPCQNNRYQTSSQPAGWVY